MKFEFKPRAISKKDFFSIKEDDLMLITNPGRMGDENGSTFLIQKDNQYILYRIDGWMYSTKEERNSENYISLEDAFSVFPEWEKAWKNCNNINHDGKYKYINMDFGCGLCVDKRIYEEYNRYLIEEIKKKTTEIDKNGNYNHCLNSSCWIPALINMIGE